MATFNPYLNGVPQWGTPPPGAMAGPGRGAGGIGAQGGMSPVFGNTAGTGGGMGPTSMPMSGGFDINQIARQSQAAGPMYGDPNSAAMGGAPSTMQQYGYGNRPGQGGGYYEQGTPVGAFAAANTNQAYNPYIGQTSQGISGYSGGQSANPYLGGSTAQASAVTNPYAGAGNPYTTQAIDAASADAARNYNLHIAPQRDAQMARSGAFGNTGVQQMQLEDQRNLQSTLGNIATGARMQDLQAQQRMGESAADRGTNVNLANSGFNAGDLNRNMAGYFSQYGLNSGQDLQRQMFNATLGSNDLNRNAQLAQGLGQFNAGQGNQVNMFNTAAGNNMLENYRNRTQRADEFNQNMDFNTWNANMGWMNQGQRNQMDFINQLMGYQGAGINSANQQQMLPLDILRQLSGIGTSIGGMGGSASGTNTTDLYGNPLLGFYGGYRAFGG